MSPSSATISAAVHCMCRSPAPLAHNFGNRDVQVNQLASGMSLDSALDNYRHLRRAFLMVNLDLKGSGPTSWFSAIPTAPGKQFTAFRGSNRAFGNQRGLTAKFHVGMQSGESLFPGFTQHLPPGVNNSAEVVSLVYPRLMKHRRHYSVFCSGLQLRPSCVSAERQGRVCPRRSGSSSQRGKKDSSSSSPGPVAGTGQTACSLAAPHPRRRPNRPVKASHHPGIQSLPGNSQGLPPAFWGRRPLSPPAMQPYTTLTLARLNVACLQQLQASQATRTPPQVTQVVWLRRYQQAATAQQDFLNPDDGALDLCAACEQR